MKKCGRFSKGGGYGALHRNGGKLPKLAAENITLKYLREYRAAGSIAAEYRACKGTAPCGRKAP
ncbi:MAG: hypothetical protein LBD55_06130 [Treponema sp.]|nr:hypothetical protein [Treponema sp.]